MSQQQISDRLQKLVQIFEKLGLPVVQDFHNLGGWGTNGEHFGLVFSADGKPQGQVSTGIAPKVPNVKLGLWFAEYPVPHTRGGHPYLMSWWRLGNELLPNYGYQSIKGNLSKASWQSIALDPDSMKILHSAINRTCTISAFEVFYSDDPEDSIGTVYVVKDMKGETILTFGDSWMPGGQEENTEYNVAFWKT